MKDMWGDKIDLEDDDIKSLLSKKPKKGVKSEKKKKNLSIPDTLKVITSRVMAVLGKVKDQIQIITEEEDLKNYIDKAIKNGTISIDTETNKSKDPLTCKIMGACLYTKGLKPAYVPINHVDYVTGELLNNQLNEQDLNKYFTKIKDNETKVIMANGGFDISVIEYTCGVKLDCYWDILTCFRLMNENLKRPGLKVIYPLLIDKYQEDYDIEDLFTLPYEYVDPSIFGMYAAWDAKMTYDVYEYELKELSKKDYNLLYKLFREVEMPIVPIVADIENYGAALDDEVCKALSDKYHTRISKLEEVIKQDLLELKPKIDAWRLTKEANVKEKKTKPNKKGVYTYSKSLNEKLPNDINIGSPTQLSILFYDVLGIEPINRKEPRSTDEKTLIAISENTKLKLCEHILDYRGLTKLTSTYIDALPQLKNPRDGRVHTSYNPLGTVTGRFSSQEPNFQNIPSHEKSIRRMFRASDGYVLVGADFSQQEPRLLAEFSQDEHMLDAYHNGKDLYATMGSMVYDMDYWDCMEHHQDGTKNGPGAKRRAAMKVLQLGISYGMQVQSVAQKLGCSVKEAQEILDTFYDRFPKVKKWKEDTEKFVRKKGYVEDLWGRRRRFPEIFKPRYSVEPVKKESSFNPLLHTKGLVTNVDESIVNKYINLCNNMKSYKDFFALRDMAYKEGYYLDDNTNLFADCERQAVNARIQGSAATMTKRAMISIYNDKIMNDLGFKMMLLVHDEIIGECPEENAEKVSERLSYLMRTCVPELGVPFKCDAVIEKNWYQGEFENSIKDQYNEMVEKGMKEDKAIDLLCEDHCEVSRDNILSYISG